MEGGTKHVTLRRFEPYRPSCTNLTSDLRDSLWLSSSRILLPTTIPLSPPMSERPRPRQAAWREGTRSANSSVAIARWGDMRAPTPAHGTHVHGTYVQGTYVRPRDVRRR